MIDNKSESFEKLSRTASPGANVSTITWPNRRVGAEDLRVRIVKPDRIDGTVAEAWANLRSPNSANSANQANSGGYSSPYFDIEFTRAVARVRNDIEIALIIRGDVEIVGILPYQRVGLNSAEPIGGLLNDVHGPMSTPQLTQASVLTKVMETAGLRSYGFHALHKTDRSLESYEFCERDSHFIDLRDGWSGYEQWSRSESKLLRRQGQKSRAMERNLGPLRLDFNCTDSAVLEQLIKLKREKYQRTHTFDILSVDWASNLLREIFQVDQRKFKGWLSALYAGDQLVAAHFGMLTDDILHYWFPVFDPSYARYSPGTELLLRVAKSAAAIGVKKVDLGYGDDPYKFKFCNAAETVSCGNVVFNRMAFQIFKRRYELRQRLKGIPMKPLAKSVLRGMFPGFGQWNFK